ncbi:MAG: hypothetical protein J3Q66DRAFT_407786 [Benniella sp.]|nr:MAG: hypothetical protein J3Q66DRAFT_407786 [Benniella sp.]
MSDTTPSRVQLDEDVDAPFWTSKLDKLQRKASVEVLPLSSSPTYDTTAVNHIWDTSEGLPVQTHKMITSSLTLPTFDFSDEINNMPCNLETELADGNTQRRWIF